MVIYRERLVPNFGLHVALLLLLPLGFGMLAPINVMWGIVNAITIYVFAVVWMTVGAPQLVVTDSTFRAGRATIERTLLTDAIVVTRAERLSALADARSWKVVRAWIPEGVRVAVSDPDDPTPYWYVSSRNAARLAAILNEN